MSQSGRAMSVESDIAELQRQFQVFGDLARLLVASDLRARDAEEGRRIAERRLREAERKLADPRMYRRGYSAGYSACQRGINQKDEPSPRGLGPTT